MTFDRNIAIAELMTTNVITVNPMDNLLTVAAIFAKHDFHHIPVVDKNNCVKGIISRVELYKLQHSLTIFNTKDSKKRNHAIFNSILVEEIMAKKVVKLRADNTALVAAGFFRENLFHALPIVDKEDQLVGILTTFDLLTYAYKEPVFMDERF